jgi:hypothetical protein
MSGIADPAARGQLKRKKTRHDLGGAIQACAGGAEATKAGSRPLEGFADESRRQGALDFELGWPGTRAGGPGSNGHVLLLPPKACLRNQCGLGESGWPPD